MKKLTFFILIAVGIAILTSCNNTILPFRIPTGDPSIPENTIVKDIPRYKENSKVYLYYKLAKQKQKQLALVVPENGYDSLLVRLWFTYPESLHQYGEMVEIKYPSEGEKEARYTKMRIFFNPSRDWEQINRHADSTILIPKNGWTNFSRKLKSLNIINLPTIERIAEYEKRGGRENYANNYLTVACEIATKDNYRFFQYNNFERHKDIFEVKLMYEFIRFVREELGMVEIDEAWYGE